MLEKTLRLLFDACDRDDAYASIEAYIREQFARIVRNQRTIDRFIFAKEYRGRDGYQQRCYVPALTIAQLSVYLAVLSLTPKSTPTPKSY